MIFYPKDALGSVVIIFTAYHLAFYPVFLNKVQQQERSGPNETRLESMPSEHSSMASITRRQPSVSTNSTRTVGTASLVEEAADSAQKRPKPPFDIPKISNLVIKVVCCILCFDTCSHWTQISQ